MALPRKGYSPGEKHGSLTSLEFDHTKVRPSGAKVPAWNFLCDCGNTHIAVFDNVRRGSISKCSACASRREKRATHNKSRAPIYKLFHGIKARCYNRNSSEYQRYGGSGVIICERWLEKRGKGFENFLEDMGERPEGTSLNRINSVKLYSKETCEWATFSMQSYDQRHSKDTLSGHVGVELLPNLKYRARIVHKGEGIHLGVFSSIEEAIAARRSAELKYYGRYTNELSY